MDKGHIYEPITEYEKIYKELHAKNVSEYFEVLVEKSGVDEQENIETVKEIKRLNRKIDAIKEHLKKIKGLKTFLIVLTVISFIVSLLFILGLSNNAVIVNKVADILIVIGTAGLGIGFIFLIVKKINKILKSSESDLMELQKQLEELLRLAWEQMAPLNNLYDWGMTAEICEKTLPFLKLDKYFDSKRFDILHNKYNLADNTDKDISILFAQSGEIKGNPFVVGKMAKHYMGMHTYTGTRTISWTETVRTKDGYSTVTRTQTLRASVTKPKPEYVGRSFLMYGSEVAPDLSFSRVPQSFHKYSERQLEKIVRRGGVKLDKKAQKSIAKGGSFTTMTDQEFDVLFGAADRDHEVQFRLLFTPLAQKEMLKVIKDDKVGYGDDFEFVKTKHLNTIMPEHLNKADVNTTPRRYIKYDIEESRKIFNEYNNSYFKSLYFSFAPLFAVPLYQQHKPREYIYKSYYESNVSSWEHEAVANSFNQAKLKNPLSVTFNILKSRVLQSKDEIDEIEVTAYGFQRFSETDYVSVRGGDGRLHSVPVHWYRYEPVHKTTNMVIKTVDTLKRNDYIKDVLNNRDWQQFLNNNLSDEGEVEYRKNLVAYTSKKDSGLPSIAELKRLLDR